MAQYKHQQYLTKSDHQEFDRLHPPGQVVQNSGVYRCATCGDEIAANKGNPLPPQNHHQHAPGMGQIQWQLLVFAVSR